MVITVYVDVLFLVNLVMDYTLLWLTSVFTRTAARPLRLLSAAAVGASYAAAVFFVPLPAVASVVGKLAVSTALVLLAFGYGNPRRFVLTLGAFYVCSLVMGGVGFALVCGSPVFQRLGAVAKNSVLYLNLPSAALVGIAAATYAVLGVAFPFIRRRTRRAPLIRTVTVAYQGRCATFPALTDTGNLVREPTTDSSVLIAEWSAVRPLFPGLDAPDAPYAVPYSAVGDARGVLPAFRPDAVRLDGGAELSGLCVGVLRRALDPSGEYRAILPADALPDPTRPRRVRRRGDGKRRCQNAREKNCGSGR